VQDIKNTQIKSCPWNSAWRKTDKSYEKLDSAWRKIDMKN